MSETAHPDTASSFAGRFVWRELVTRDPAAAAAFYAQTFGWTAADANMPMPYTMLHQPGLDDAVAGAMGLPAPQVPPHWVDYITVDDLEAAMAAVKEHGGQLHTEAIAIPGVGRFASASDPLGGVFALFVGENPGSSADPERPPVGSFCWSQLMTSDIERSVAFYRAVFGWDAAPMGPTMVVFNDATGRGRASAMLIPDGAPQPQAWLKYVAVEEVAPVVAAAQAAGATVMAPPTVMPGMGEFSVLIDPQGAAFAVWKDLSGTAAQS